MPLSAIEEERGGKNVQTVYIETSSLLNEIYSKNFCSYRVIKIEPELKIRLFYFKGN